MEKWLGATLSVSVLLFVLATGVVGCSQQVPQDSVENASKNALSNNPATPIGSGGQVVPAPSSTPTPSTSSCPAGRDLNWMIQDVSYTIDFASSEEKRSYLCHGSVPETAVGTGVDVVSTNGNQGSIRMNCVLISGTPQWRVTYSNNVTTGAPVGSSCGLYNSSYRPAVLSKVKYIRAASLQPNGEQTMYGVSMLARSYYSGTGDHLFSSDKTEGPGAGYQLEGLGFNVIHLAGSQDNGSAAGSVAPAGLIKIHRCNSPMRGRHYMTTAQCNEAAGDIYEGSRYIFQSSTVPALGVTKVPLYRCRNSVNDLVTSMAECAAVQGTSTLIGYTIE